MPTYQTTLSKPLEEKLLKELKQRTVDLLASYQTGAEIDEVATDLGLTRAEAQIVLNELRREGKAQTLEVWVTA